FILCFLLSAYCLLPTAYCFIQPRAHLIQPRAQTAVLKNWRKTAMFEEIGSKTLKTRKKERLGFTAYCFLLSAYSFLAALRRVTKGIMPVGQITLYLSVNGAHDCRNQRRGQEFGAGISIKKSRHNRDGFYVMVGYSNVFQN